MKVGFIGLGWMGRGMCKCIVRGGHDVMVYDVLEEPMDDLVKYGAKYKSKSIKEVAEYADVVSVVVRTEPQVDEVVLELIKDLKAGSMIIIQSTVSPLQIRRLNDEAQKKGVSVIDAPITGQKREEGGLTVMIGASDADFQKAVLVLQQQGRMLHMGDVGCGEITKIVSNYISTCSVFSATEGLMLGMKAGINKEKLLEQLADPESPGHTWVCSHWENIAQMKQIYRETYKGPLELMHKDMKLFNDLARDLRLELPVGSLLSNINGAKLPEDVL